ncbi:hypothetical protein BJX76DRAFT_65047 [Aspergillus varians]
MKPVRASSTFSIFPFTDLISCLTPFIPIDQEPYSPYRWAVKPLTTPIAASEYGERTHTGKELLVETILLTRLTKATTLPSYFIMPRTRQLLRRQITYASAKEEEVNILHQLGYYDKQIEFFSYLNNHQGWIKNIIAHHLHLNSPELCHVSNVKDWLHGSFNVCIPVTISTRNTKRVILRPRDQRPIHK